MCAGLYGMSGSGSDAAAEVGRRDGHAFWLLGTLRGAAPGRTQQEVSDQLDVVSHEIDAVDAAKA